MLPLDGEGLAARYPAAHVVRRGGRTYPAALSAVAELDSIDALVRTTTDEVRVDEQLRAAGQAHLDAIRAGNPGAFDGPVLALTRQADGRVVAGRGHYFDMLATCDALREEWEADPAHTPLRDRADALAGGDPVARGDGRAAAIGISVAVTVGTGAERSVLLGHRSADVAMDPGRWHIAPSGMLEPGSGLEPVASALLRELAEETGVGQTGPPRLLGVGFDLTRLRPEICLQVEAGNAAVRVAGVEFDDGELVPLQWESLWQRFGPDDLTPAAAATLALLEGRLG